MRNNRQNYPKNTYRVTQSYIHSNVHIYVYVFDYLFKVVPLTSTNYKLLQQKYIVWCIKAITSVFN